jgi:methylated-DNA-[protein]-cysteine S-methyltransferase
MKAAAYAIFTTQIGPCALVWGDGGIVGAFLPERNLVATRARILRKFPLVAEAEPPETLRGVVDLIQALLSGEPADLTDAALDMDGISEFDRAVYAVARSVPPGSTITYGEIAARLGEPGAARAVGRAMGANPFPIIVPCHRVLGADGKVGGFSATGGVETKAKLLSIERARTDNAPLLFDELAISVRPSPTAAKQRPKTAP